MSLFKVTGRVVGITPERIVPTKKEGAEPFKIVDVLVEESEVGTDGVQRTNQYVFSAMGKAIDRLANLKVGAVVETSFSIRCRTYVRDGVTQAFTTLNLIGFKSVYASQQPVAAMPAAAYTAPAGPINYPGPKVSESSDASVDDDLPF